MMVAILAGAYDENKPPVYEYNMVFQSTERSDKFRHVYLVWKNKHHFCMKNRNTNKIFLSVLITLKVDQSLTEKGDLHVGDYI